MAIKIENPEEVFGRACEHFRIPGNPSWVSFHCEECPVIRKTLVDIQMKKDRGGFVNMGQVCDIVEKNMQGQCLKNPSLQPADDTLE